MYWCKHLSNGLCCFVMWAICMQIRIHLYVEMFHVLGKQLRYKGFSFITHAHLYIKKVCVCLKIRTLECKGKEMF